MAEIIEFKPKSAAPVETGPSHYTWECSCPKEEGVFSSWELYNANGVMTIVCAHCGYTNNDVSWFFTKDNPR